jgi:hypothetical protein
MICETHGRVGFVETCSHVAKQIDARKLPNGRRFTFLTQLMVCDECYSALGFDRVESLFGLPAEEVLNQDDHHWEAVRAAYEQIEGRRLFCLKCVAELERQLAAL